MSKEKITAFAKLTMLLVTGKLRIPTDVSGVMTGRVSCSESHESSAPRHDEKIWPTGQEIEGMKRELPRDDWNRVRRNLFMVNEEHVELMKYVDGKSVGWIMRNMGVSYSEACVLRNECDSYFGRVK